MINWNELKVEWETTDISLADLADKHAVKLGTLKSRKSREKWVKGATHADATSTPKDATNLKVDASTNERRQIASSLKEGEHKRSGNPNPSNQFTKRNRAAETHGFFSKFLPEETLEIMEAMNERSPADLIWDQIQIQYAAIIRAQRIMHVESKDEMIKELKKGKYDFIQTGEGEEKQIERVATEEEYEFQFAWERQAQLLTAQSRAIGELRSSIRQFTEMTDAEDERRLKLEQMQLSIDKTKAEITNLNKDQGEVVRVIIEDDVYE